MTSEPLEPELQAIVDRTVADLRKAFYEPDGTLTGAVDAPTLIGLADDLAVAVQLAFTQMETDLADLEPVRAALRAYREGRLARAC